MLTDKQRDDLSDGVFELCTLESSKGTYKIIQYSLLYRFTHQNYTNSVSPFSAIQRAFERLIELYPILRGYRVQLPDRNIIATSDHSKPGPLFEIIDACQMTADEFEKVKFHRDQWPAKVDSALKSRTADIGQLIAGTVVRFADGYLAALSVSHIVADGVAVYLLLRQWASLAQRLAADGDNSPMPELPIDFDHPAFWHKLSAHPHDAHPFVEYINSQDFGSMSALQAKLSTWYATGSLSGGDTLAMRLLHVSPAAIEAITKEYNALSDGRPALHGAQILYALLWQRYVATVIETQTESDMAYTLPLFLTMMCSLRQVTPAPDYIGNAVGSVLVPCDTKDVLAMPIIDLARLVKTHLRQITPGSTVHYINEAFGGDGSFFAKNVYVCTRVESRLTISNMSRLAYFDIDFGHGKPIALLAGTLPTEGMTFWLPSADGGIDMYYGLKDDIYSALKCDMVLRKFIEFLN
ncbi:hypothetical protein IW146_002589 [Coemansia sp. RSA 922]|nr:hypothetical protein H4S03_000085 [Coemansia sp. S3946]KAJ2054305.1 hypothetical protein H4S04_000061 [Coemansia sp. S16]KAJ2066230.1 hypothetical protein GGI08_001970 [Coemansia sp. S2]KAJ2115079.1 hypothetical protein IW146_002589 [Coemansia sp. RSA 922]KAJ2353700.1 hypothetical protein GGH92_000488 [Coemansia sp. RSA 2673]